MTLTTAELAHYLLTFIAWPTKSEARNRWRLDNAEQLLRSVDVLPGHASAIQAARGDGIGRLGGVSSKQLWQGSKHSRSACSFCYVPRSTGKQDIKDGASLLSCLTFLSTCSKNCGPNATLSNERRVTEPTPSQNGNVNPRRVSHCWQVTKETPSPRKTR